MNDNLACVMGMGEEKGECEDLTEERAESLVERRQTATIETRRDAVLSALCIGHA
jgi:hypothetical protein